MKKLGLVILSLFLFVLAGALVLAVGLSTAYYKYTKDLPKIVTTADYHPAGVTRVFGTSFSPFDASPPSPTKPGPPLPPLMAEFYKERRYIIPYDQIPKIVIQAFISAEDDKFFEHSGVNLLSMVRAGIANFRAGHVVQGGSTITQQVAKSLVLTSERSFDRKIKEVLVAASMEKNLTKQQILYLYLNQIYLGHGAYGVQGACLTYFNKDLSKITLAEAALLAGLTQAPGKYSPILNPTKAKERQKYVLRRMFENKSITQAELASAAAEPLRVYSRNEDPYKNDVSYFIETVRKYLIDKYGEKAIYEDGLNVYVPVSPELLRAARKSLRDGLEKVDQRIGYRGPIQHLATTAEMESFLQKAHLELIEKTIPFQILMSDGKLSAAEAMRSAGIRSDAQLLEVGECEQAVVTRIDDMKKTANVMIGGVLAELTFDKMTWAKPRATKPSDIVSKGDVILVKIEKALQTGSVLGVPEFTVSLSQIPELQGAVFSMDANTGFVLSLQGGYDFEQSEFNRATQAQRQPGSAFKPIIYSAAIEHGYTPASIIVDSPVVYEDSQLGKWKPANFEEKFYGDTTFRQALIKSRNVPTIKIVQALQVRNVIDFAKRLGMVAQFSPDLSISLGSATVSLMEMVRTYALFPRLGKKVTPVLITKVTDRDGKILEEQKPQPPGTGLVFNTPEPTETSSPSPSASMPAMPNKTPSPAEALAKLGLSAYPPANDPDQVLDPRVAYIMTHLMKEVVNYGTGYEARHLGRPAAGKTGTTNEYMDAWFMGFTPNVVTGVWVGFDSQKTIGRLETGARAALPIWVDYMREAVKGYPSTDFSIPPGIVFASIDPNTGKLASPHSSTSIKEAFIEGTEPKKTDDKVKFGNGSTTGSDFFKEDVD